MLTPPDHFLWDFWFAPRESGEPYHLFYLSAPRSLPDPEERHWHARISHAVSEDLINWTPLGLALEPGTPGNWDDLATWTGSIFRWDDNLYFFYTGIETRTRGKIQRIGCATSIDNGMNWQKVPDPLVQPDGAQYVSIANMVRGGADFRDPWVMRDPDAERFLMFFTAAAPGHPADRCGVVGLAESTDLVNWRLLPPVTPPGFYGQVEVPQPLKLGDRWYLLFCTNEQAHDLAAIQEAAPWMGTHYFVSDSLTGPYDVVPGPPLLADEAGTWYAGRVTEDPKGNPVLLTWRRLDDDGNFVGGLSSPARLAVGRDGSLNLVDSSQLWA